MLVELHVRDLGVFEDVSISLGAGMTALTGETGAGKTLLVEALELLLGGRADPVTVRAGAAEALAEARFEGVALVGEGEEGAHEGADPDDAVILARAVPAAGGRSRAWCDGRMAPVARLSEAGALLVDLYGQHGQQSLFDPAAQRRGLDAFAQVDSRRLRHLRAERRRLRADMETLGGDERARAREIDLLRHQLGEIEAARLEDPDEDDALGVEEERLAEAARYREQAAQALADLEPDTDSGADIGAVDRLGAAAGVLAGRPALETLAARLSALQVDAADVASDLRRVLQEWEDDPERLAEVRARRQLLRELARKYGEGVAGVLAYGGEARRRLDDLESLGERLAGHDAALATVDAEIGVEEAAVGSARRQAAPALARAVEERMATLAMSGARLEVQVGEDPGDEVRFLLGANPGEPLLPLAKVASGGELARAMLALRLVLSEAPPTMVFDEVDAGVGGEAAVSVGRALAELARRHQVLVVTHLAQVAAFADRQLVVRKDERGGRTVADVQAVDGDERVVELARMLSGQPDSARARRHAEELLAAAGATALHR